MKTLRTHTKEGVDLCELQYDIITTLVNHLEPKWRVKVHVTSHSIDLDCFCYGFLKNFWLVSDGNLPVASIFL